MKCRLSVAVTALALGLGMAHAQQPVVIEFSHVVAENTPLWLPRMLGMI